MSTSLVEPNARAGEPRVMNVDETDAVWFERSILDVLPDLIGAARRLTRNSADAEDLVADAVAKAWLGLASLKDRSRFRGWIFRILTNEFLAQRRSRAARPDPEALPDETGEFSIFEQLHQPFLLWWSNPEKEFLDKLLREDLVRAIERVPEPFRMAVILADVHGLSYQEIAAAVGVPIGTVRSRLARGRSLLQKALWEHARDAGVRTQPRNRDVT
ncbi:MAG: sigma-70 family RNA polymerase sigma factor [Gemmatimonadaceae bacterium]